MIKYSNDEKSHNMINHVWS